MKIIHVCIVKLRFCEYDNSIYFSLKENIGVRETS